MPFRTIPRSATRAGRLLLGLACLIPAAAQAGPTLDSFDPHANDSVYALAAQADGRLLVGGQFTQAGGQPRARLARFRPDGSLDAGFDPGADGIVSALLVQPDAKIVLAGWFAQVHGQPRARLARVNADGSLDAAFSPAVSRSGSAAVFAVARQTDGKLLVGGQFDTVNGQARSNLARLHADGRLDESFSVALDGYVKAIAVQSDGRILVGGIFTRVGGALEGHLIRLEADGRLDGGFGAPFYNAGEAVNALALQSDGRILVGGSFGSPALSLVRVDADGSVDDSFQPHVSQTAGVAALALQADGKVLFCGSFGSVGGQPRKNLARVNADGSLDATFQPPAATHPQYTPGFNAVLAQPGGVSLVGGVFTALDGAPRGFAARLRDDAIFADGFD
jgi:uncharacterized delta-60 repeat protein